ncbi:MAG: hypothetical protein U0350_27405 [Caldilineaceae bacterium]
MKSIVVTLSGFILFLCSVLTAKAESVVYLPFVENPAAVKVVTERATPDFTVDNLRLWYVSENGGAPTPALQCGDQSKVQVHVFDVTGDHGDQSRLNNVAVHVVRFDEQGTRTEDIFYTGQANGAKGVVEFKLQRSAEVRISYDLDGQPVHSAVANVTNLAYAIPTNQLIASGYCTDALSCQALVNTGVCNGRFSWNVVFKRSY